MKDIYNYNNNINITTTPNGDKVVTMNEEILVAIINRIFEAAESYRAKGLYATAEDTMELWKALSK